MRHQRHAAVVVLVLCLLTLGCTSPAPDAAPAVSATPATSGSAVAAEPVGPVLRYVALGDSLTSGMGGDPSYADFYRRGLQRRTERDVKLTNLGYPGWTSAQLLDALRHDKAFRTAIGEADVVTWDIGANDIIHAAVRSMSGDCGGPDDLRCVRQAVQRFTMNWDEIIDELVALRRGPDVTLLTFDLYTPLIPPNARTAKILRQLDTMNATITASEGRDGVQVAPVSQTYAGSPGDLLDDDGLHPSRTGHRLIARLLLELGPLPPG
jgi:acyl-CoA thioesterase I